MSANNPLVVPTGESSQARGGEDAEIDLGSPPCECNDEATRRNPPSSRRDGTSHSSLAQDNKSMIPQPPPGSTYMRRNTLDGAVVTSTLELLKADMEKERLVHLLAATHFAYLYDWLLFLPSVLLTLVGGILAFASMNSGLISEEDSAPMAMSVGIISLVSVFWQSLTKQLNYGGRAMVHNNAAVALKRLVDQIPFVELDPNFSVEETDKFVSQMNEKYMQALDSTSVSSPPLKVSAAFYSAFAQVDRRLDLHDRNDGSAMSQFCDKREILYNACSAELFTVITNTRLFPLRLPSPKYAAETAFANLQKQVQEGGHVHKEV